MDAKIDRKAYIKYLNNIFKKLGLKKYTKNNVDMYRILEQYGNQINAIRYSAKLLELHKGKTHYDSKPSTRVFALIEELNQYM